MPVIMDDDNDCDDEEKTDRSGLGWGNLLFILVVVVGFIAYMIYTQ